jgi:AcrR family transcriptional regulator
VAKSTKPAGSRARAAPRRSQADRSAETRARILAAAVRCVDELGFARATFQRIARRAGVTVGAVQHHFAAKEDVLRAVLEDSFEHLSRCFDGVCVEGADLGERVSVFIDRAWLHCGYPPFRSTLEILMTTRGDDGGAHWTDTPLLESTRRVQRLWRSVFSEVEIPAARHLEVLRFAFAALAGIAMTVRLEQSRAGTARQLALLKAALVALLEQVESESRSPRHRSRSAVQRNGSP